MLLVSSSNIALLALLETKFLRGFIMGFLQNAEKFAEFIRILNDL